MIELTSWKHRQLRRVRRDCIQCQYFMFYIVYNMWLSRVISGPVCTTSTSYSYCINVMLQTTCCPYALSNVCAIVFYCLVKYTLANLVNDSRACFQLSQ